MSILTASNLAKSYGPTEIFPDINLEIPHGARIALVGPNGAGKTTLMNILIGEELPTEGVINRAKNLRIGFLPQRPELLGDHTLWEEALGAFDVLRAREAELKRLEEKLAQGDEAALNRYGDLQEQFELDGGYTYIQRIKRVLEGLGFSEEEFQQTLPRLSGGQKTRAVLARLLLEAPDLLMLDEPTNHLDISAVEWLEGFLKEFEGAVVAISHDRYFIDEFASTVWELDRGFFEIYRANYTQYIAQRTERHERRQKEFEAQRAFIAKEEDYIRRNIAGQNTRQAQGRRKRLDRLKRDNLINAPQREKDRMNIQMEINHRGNEHVLITDNLQIGYPDSDVPLLDVKNIKLGRGEIAALIGPNGVGKSSFIKTVTGQISPYNGDVLIGDKVEIGYFAQAHEGLNPANSIIDEIMNAREMLPAEARNYLARYLFRGDEVFRKIGTLSGGERGRVALAKLALGTANLLLLDEPTNHLDIPSQEVLEEILSDYAGTVLLVSHDRYLVDALATQIWAARAPEVDGGTGWVDVFNGSYTEYIQARNAQREADAKKSNGNGRAAATQSGSNKKTGLNSFGLQKRIAEIETRIEELEAYLESLTSQIEQASVDGRADEVQTLGELYTQTQGDLETAMAEWESLHVDD